ncbi:hypothetical protein NtRootA1_08570 [Arthrobacter sp. NtRootA1]|nr:hypothetical protein NtRootA1_08570 [Arthrobacter sp. NtRootA1]
MTAGYLCRMKASWLARQGAKIGSKIGQWIEAAYVLDCVEPATDPGDREGHGRPADWTWLPALSGVRVASAQAIQSHSGMARRNP